MDAVTAFLTVETPTAVLIGTRRVSTKLRIARNDRTAQKPPTHSSLRAAIRVKQTAMVTASIKSLLTADGIASLKTTTLASPSRSYTCHIGIFRTSSRALYPLLFTVSPLLEIAPSISQKLVNSIT